MENFENYMGVDNQGGSQFFLYKGLAIFIVVFIRNILSESFSLSSSMVQFANTLGSVFLGAIDEQCMVCDEDPKQLLTFLSKGTGAQLLLMLNIVGDKVNIDFDLKLKEDNVKFFLK